MKRTFCWACTLLGTVAAFSVFALLAKPAMPVLAAILTTIEPIAH